MEVTCAPVTSTHLGMFHTTPTCDSWLVQICSNPLGTQVTQVTPPRRTVCRRALSPIMMQGQLVLPLTIFGMSPASHTRSFATPCTRPPTSPQMAIKHERAQRLTRGVTWVAEGPPSGLDGTCYYLRRHPEIHRYNELPTFHGYCHLLPKQQAPARLLPSLSPPPKLK